MADFTIRPDELFNLDVALDHAPGDSGLTYEIPRSMRHYASVDPVTGLVTPKGRTAVILVIVKNADGDIVDRVVIAIVSSQQYAFDAEDHDVTREEGPPIP